MKFDIKKKRRLSNTDRSMIKIPTSHDKMASRLSNTIFLQSDRNEFCNRVNLLLQEKQAGNNSDLINEEIIPIVDKLFEYKCISKKKHEQILINCILLHTKKK